jgi:hypothetical protein
VESEQWETLICKALAFHGAFSSVLAKNTKHLFDPCEDGEIGISADQKRGNLRKRQEIS